MRNRQTIYTIVRTSPGGHVNVIDSFATRQRAEEIAAGYDFQFTEKGVKGFQFTVHATTYYDE